MEAVDLLVNWIDDPTEERFERICSLIFDDREPPDHNPDPHGVIAWALFLVIKAMNRMKRDEPPPPSAPSKEVLLLTEIRDALKARS